MISKQNLKGIIICGGNSSRMGRDKSQILWQGKPFYHHCIDSIREYCDDVYISCNSKQAKNYDYPVIIDKYSDIGPIAGILSSFELLPEQALMTIPCDMPFVNKIILDEIVEAFTSRMDGVFIRDMKGNIEPLLAIYNYTMYNELLNSANTGNYSLKKVIESNQNSHIIQVKKNNLLNLNTKDDFDQFSIYPHS